MGVRARKDIIFYCVEVIQRLAYCLPVLVNPNYLSIM